MSDFKTELRILINRESRERGSGTPDMILAEYLSACLDAFDAAVNAREAWHGRRSAVQYGEMLIGEAWRTAP